MTNSTLLSLDRKTLAMVGLVALLTGGYFYQQKQDKHTQLLKRELVRLDKRFESKETALKDERRVYAQLEVFQFGRDSETKKRQLAEQKRVINALVTELERLKKRRVTIETELSEAEGITAQDDEEASTVLNVGN